MKEEKKSQEELDEEYIRELNFYAYASSLNTIRGDAG